MTEVSTAHELAEIVIRALAKGTVVEIDGLGAF
jgi:nucleoid DNA-binding protein